MGCGCSCCGKDVEAAIEKGELVPIVPNFETSGPHPSLQHLGDKHNPTKNITITCGGLFCCAAADTTIDVLFLYPDAVYANMKATTRIEHQADVTDRGRPSWESIRVELKEFDSADDMLKEWYDDGGQIPGVHYLETAGPLGAWGSLEPHAYQQRYVLPNGRRVAHPGVDKGFKPSQSLKVVDTDNADRNITYISLPRRLYNLYKVHGEHHLKKLIGRVEASILKIQLAAKVSGIPSQYENFVCDWTDLFLHLPDELEKFKDYNTVHDITHEKLQPLVSVLAEIEDALLFNWFEVSLLAEMEIGKYKGSSVTGELKQSKSIWDRILARCIDHVDEMGDKAVIQAREYLSVKMVEEIRKFFDEKGKDEGDDDDDDEDLVDLLFPDLDDIMERAVMCVDFEAVGLNSSLPNNDETIERYNNALAETQQDAKIESIDALIAAWREADARPIGTRRREYYEQTIAEAEEICDASLYFRRAKFIAELCMHPHIVPKHFNKFTFYLVFPQWDDDELDDMKRPEKALIKLWPEGGEYSKAVTASMTTFELEPINTKMDSAEGVTNKIQQVIASLATDGFDEGDSSIDSDDEDDPRNKWVPYPSKNFRGFEVTMEVAVDCTYFFHFILDGVLFLDHDSYFNDTSSGIYGRKVRFTSCARPFTINPLVTAGMALQ